MNFLKSLGFTLFFLAGTIFANVDDTIRKNESVINALQKELDALQSKGEESSIKDLQDHIDEVIKKQNELLARKAAGDELVGENATVPNTALVSNDVALDSKIRSIVKEELAKQQLGLIPSNPYAAPSRVPTAAEQHATQEAVAHAPPLPEQQSEAIAQYELALAQYNKSAYKEAAAGFGRIIKTYKNDSIATKALVHLAYCLEKQGDLESAAVVCESALQKKLDGMHQVDCQLIRLRNAKSKGNAADVTAITKGLQGLTLTVEQKSAFESLKAKKVEAPKGG